MSWEVLTGDCVEVMRGMPDASVDAVVTDPPYDLTNRVPDVKKCCDCGRVCGGRDGNPAACPRCGGELYNQRSQGKGFMGKDWDGTGVAFRVETWAEVLRVLKPGGHLLAMGGTRTEHRMTCAIEDAGFEIRDSILYWGYGTGFPKSRRVDMDERFCHCDASGHTNSRTSLVPAPDDRTHTAAASRDDGLPLADAGRSKRTLSDSPGDCQPDRDSDDGLVPQPGADGRAVVPQSQYAPGHIRSDAHEDAGGYEPAHTLSQAQRSDHLANLGSALREPAAACIRDGIQVSTTVSGNSPTRTDTAASGDRISRMVSQSSAPGTTFPVKCTKCGKPMANGWGTALKPAYEPITLARKPLSEPTVAANVLQHGTGAINVEACRIEGDGNTTRFREAGQRDRDQYRTGTTVGPHISTMQGRWPANVVLDADAAALLDAQSGERKSGGVPPRRNPDGQRNTYGAFAGQAQTAGIPASTGGASRYFYVAKASRSERSAGLPDGMTNGHPTVKPLQLCRWLVKLVCPPNGVVLDPFTGSGSVGCAAAIEGFNFIGIDADADYCTLARQRIAHWAGLTEEAA